MDIRRRMLFKKKAGSSGGGSTTGGSYTVNLNSQWEAITVVPNPDSTLYDGVYRSSSNYNVNNGVSIMYITIKDCSSFKMYIRSYAESSYDYVMVSQLDKTINGNTTYSDTTLVKAHTRDNQQSGTALSNYTLVEFTGISSGEHTITVVYKKDSSQHVGDDRGYVLIEKMQADSGDDEPDVPESGGSLIRINVGDIAYWDGSKVKTISLDSWSASLGTPVGVVVVPEGFTPDGKARIFSLKYVDSNGNQSDSHQYLYWETSGNYVDTSLTNYNRVPTTDNAGSTSTGSNNMGYLPSDKFTGRQSYVDPEAEYYGSSNLIPSPYLGDEPNPEYYKAISGYNNALSDFNGFSNTQTLVGLGSDYQAANACWKYKDGASNLQWYLPAMGELGYLMPRFNLINASLTAVGGIAVPGDNYFWSSSEHSSFKACYLHTYTGYVNCLDKDHYYYVRPFCTIENNNGINTDDYLTIEALEDGLTASLSANACEYCVDGDGNWKSLDAYAATESINSGHTLSFRGELTPITLKGIGTFTINKKCNLKGNCMSMLFGDNASNNYSLSGKSCAFYGLFYNCSNIITVSENFLPATTLSYACYFYMFYCCTSLTTAPELPATNLVQYCYRYMFADCTNLNYIKMLATDIPPSDCLYYWVKGVASSGTFVKSPNMTTLLTGSFGIPEGWTVVNDEEESGGGSLTFPVTLVEGDNGQVGIDLYNYLSTAYPDNNSGPQRISETIIISNGSLENKLGSIMLYVFCRLDGEIWLSNEGEIGDYYCLMEDGYLYGYDD